MITWNDLDDKQRAALKTYGDGKRCYNHTSDAVGYLAYHKLMVCVMDDISEISWYEITDAGRRVLAEAEAASGAGEWEDLALQAGGTLAVVMSWLRGSRGNMDDLTTQDVYNMIAKEYGYPAQTITTTLVESAEIARLRSELDTARAALAEFVRIDDACQAYSNKVLADFTETCAYVGRRPIEDALKQAKELSQS